MTAKKPFLTCAECGKTFPNDQPIRKYCSLHCALFSRVIVAGIDDCWLWAASHDGRGYGHFGWGRGKHYKCHRLAHELVFGPIPGLHACHSCDTPRCCNPYHIFAGTQSDNMRDMDSKGRRVNAPQKGSKHGMSLLTEDKVRQIRHKWSSKISKRAELAEEFGVAIETINGIVYGFSWRHVTA